MTRMGRGQLSSLDLMPPAASGIITWAARELADRKRTQTDIYGEFVTQCQSLMAEHRGELEFTIPAFSSFHRFAFRKAQLARRLSETQEITAVLASKWDAKSSDELTITTSEMIKSLVLHMTGEGVDGMLPKDLMLLSSAVRNAQQAQNMSSDRLTKEDKKLAERVGEAVDSVARARGLTGETAEAIKAQILGLQA